MQVTDHFVCDIIVAFNLNMYTIRKERARSLDISESRRVEMKHFVMRSQYLNTITFRIVGYLSL